MATPPRPPQALYESLWWAFTLLLAALVLAPIYTQLPDFPFFLPNLVYIVVAITLTRYLFLLRISWLRDLLTLQGFLSLALVPLIFWMVENFNAFVIFFDEEGPDVLIRQFAPGTGEVLNNYLRTEFRFFGIWAIVASVLMPFRLIYNGWARYLKVRAGRPR